MTLGIQVLRAASGGSQPLRLRWIVHPEALPVVQAAEASATPAGFPSSDHVFVIMLENQDFSQVFPSGGATNCSSSGMPYLCGLAAANGMALHFYSNAHGSLLAYLFNTSGADWKGKPYDCTGTACSSAGVIKGDNIVRALNNANKTWRGYFEGMPHCGYMGASAGNYTAAP